MVERRHQHLDPCPGHHPHPLEQVLLGRRRGDERTWGRPPGDPVDELVGAHAGDAERPHGGAGEKLTPCRAHVERDGAISTSDASSRFR